MDKNGLSEKELIEFLEKNGPLPQYGHSMKVVYDNDGNVKVDCEEKIKMKVKTNQKGK